jgi:DNA-binding MarR family transcriptional regulator
MPDVTLYIKIREVQMMLSMLARLWHNNMSQHLAEHTDGLSPLQYAVLRMSNENAMTLSEISRKLGVDPSTLVPVVDALETRA